MIQPPPRRSLLVAAAVGVRYRPEAPGAAREADAVQVEAYTGNRRLICDGLDATQLTAFADRRGSRQIEIHNDTN